MNNIAPSERQVVLAHKKWGEKTFNYMSGIECPECNSSDIEFEVTDYGDVAMMCGRCCNEIICIPCWLILQHPS